MSLDILIVEILKSHSDTSHSVGHIWTSDQTEAEISDITQHSEKTDIHDLGGIRTRNPSQGAVADPCLRTRGNQDRPKKMVYPHCVITCTSLAFK